MTKQEIEQKYLVLHDALGTRKEAEDKELFDQQHRQIWADCDTELKARKAELEAKETLTLEEQKELAELEELFPTIPEPTPPLSTHPARLDNINPGALKPATVTRIFLTEDGFTTLWNGKEWHYDCYVTQSVVDEWQAGDIVAGDFVLVHFLESDVSKPLITHKIFRSW